MSKINPSASYGVSVTYQAPNQAGMLAIVAQAVANCHGSISEIKLLDYVSDETIRELSIDAPNSECAEKIIEAIAAIPEIKIIEKYDRTYKLHEKGKLSVESRCPVNNQAQLSMAYTPGVARVCNSIKEDPAEAYKYTIKQNTVAVVTDGSAVLGLGNIGPLAGLPVMEGKAVLFKEFGGVDAFPICLETQDTEEIIKAVKLIEPVFGGINLEDISAPRCFEIEARLKKELSIPVFHDDQHGTAIVTLAALENALKLTSRKIADIKVVINGAGAAGITVGRLLRRAGVQDIVMCDSKGILSTAREGLTEEKMSFAVSMQGSLADALVGADVFVGVSVPGVLTRSMVEAMNEKPIIFAMANPIPEIQPELINDIAAVVATGRSDYPNQINNVLAFPGIFRGVLDCRAKDITIGMHIKAAEAIASLISDEELEKDYIIPAVFDKRVAPAVAEAVKLAAQNEGLSQV